MLIKGKENKIFANNMINNNMIKFFIYFLLTIATY